MKRYFHYMGENGPKKAVRLRCKGTETVGEVLTLFVERFNKKYGTKIEVNQDLMVRCAGATERLDQKCRLSNVNESDFFVIDVHREVTSVTTLPSKLPLLETPPADAEEVETLRQVKTLVKGRYIFKALQILKSRTHLYI